MKLGSDTVGHRSRRVTGSDARGNDVVTNVDVELRWCSVTPLSSSEVDDESLPRVTGLRLLAPGGSGIGPADEIVWPITGRSTGPDGQLQLAGPVYEVVGDVGLWGRAAEDATLRRS